MDDLPISLEELDDEPKKPLTRNKKRGKQKPAVADKDTSVIKQDVPVYKVIHFYTRPTDTFSAVKREAIADAELHSNSVRIVIHDHDYGNPCGNSSCGLIPTS
jgi:hypothetical protein